MSKETRNALRESLEECRRGSGLISRAAKEFHDERDAATEHLGEAWREYRQLWLRWFEERVEKKYARRMKERAQAEVVRLQAALKTHGRHLDTCYRYAWGLLHTEESDCDCKLNAALRGEPSHHGG